MPGKKVNLYRLLHQLETKGGADHHPPETQTHSVKHDLPQVLGHLKQGLPAVQQGLQV